MAAAPVSWTVERIAITTASKSRRPVLCRSAKICWNWCSKAWTAWSQAAGGFLSCEAGCPSCTGPQVGLAAAAAGIGNGTAAEITRTGELFDDFSSAGYEIFQHIRHLERP